MAKPRQIRNLKWAALADRNPFPGPARLTGSRAQGIAFQNKVASLLQNRIDQKLLEGKLLCDLWLMFEDEAGNGFAQPDMFLLEPKRIVCLECKLTQNPVAWQQLNLLYRPLLLHMFPGREFLGVQVFKHARTPEPDRPRVSLHGAKPLDFQDGALWQHYR